MKRSSPWFPYLHSRSGCCVRLFCLPYAGGGASIYCDWRKYLPTKVNVCPVELPGRETRFHELPFTCLSSLTSQLAHALQPYLDMPFAFYGHSFGALVSYEVTQLLRREFSHDAMHLFVSARHAPQVKPHSPPLHRMAKEALLDKLKVLGGTSDQVLRNDELTDLLLPVIRADLRMCEDYTYRPVSSLPCSVSAFGGKYDSEITYSELFAWRELTAGNFKVEMFSGGHFFLNENKRVLLQTIYDDLSRHNEL